MYATGVNFLVGVDDVIDGSTTVGKSNAGDYTAIGFFNGSNDFSGLDVSSASAFNSAISGTALSIVPVPAIPNVWSSTIDSGAAGNYAGLFIYKGDLATTTQWGVAYTSYATGALGTESVNFAGTSNTWDSALVGTLSSGTLSLVPEPSTYAMLAGALALGYVMVRRRKA